MTVNETSMYRTIIEADTEELTKCYDAEILSEIKFLKEVEFLEVLSLLKHDRKEIAAVWRVKFKNPLASLESIPKGRDDILQFLEREKNGSYIFFYRRRLKYVPKERNFWAIGGFISMPYEISEGKVKLTFLGNERQKIAFLSFIKKLGVHYKVVLAADAQFSPSSPFNCLTDKQRKAIITAFKLGYYDIPRRIDSTALAKEMGITNPAFVQHRRKAERRILAKLMSDS